MTNVKDPFYDSLKFLIELGRDMICLITPKTGGRHPYWVYCLELADNYITNMYINDYSDGDIPIDQRFLEIKAKFKDYYFLFEEDFSKELIYLNDNGKKVFNSEWIKADCEESSYDDFDDENIPEKISFESQNRNIRITLVPRNKKNKYDIEFPLTEMFEAALVLKKQYPKESRNYPYAVVYAIYQCIINAEPNHSPMMETICYEIHDMAVKTDSGIEKGIKTAKKYVGPIVENNPEIFGGLFSSVYDGIEEIPEENMEQMSNEAHNYMKKLNKTGGSLNDIMGSFLPGSADDEDVSEKMKSMGVTEENIKLLIDPSLKDSMTDEELKNSIPTAFSSDRTFNDFMNENK